MAAAAPFCILPLGDSITFGEGSSHGGGYRLPLFRRALRDGHAITFSGLHAAGPAEVDGVPFPARHEGYQGITIGGVYPPGLSSVAAGLVAHAKPDCVLLMIGTNDMNGDLELEHAPARLGAVIDQVLGTDPKLALLVAELVPSREDEVDAKIVQFNAALPAVVHARGVPRERLALVSMHDAFTRDPDYKITLMADHLHPNDAGYEPIAEAWYAELAPRLSRPR